MERKTTVRWRGRVLALGAAAVTLWTAAVTAGSVSLRSAAEALRTEAASPLRLLRWELGDVWGDDTLSPAAVLAIGESPLLLAAREEVAELWRQEETDAASSETAEPDTAVAPVEETPLNTGAAADDNGVAARTLVPSSPEGYTVVGKVYISNSTSHALDVQTLTRPCDAVLTEEEPQILILHTHGSESYTPAAGTAVTYSGSHRTTDTRYNVVHVGDVMSQEFAAAGISVLHDRTLYDYPSYSGAYDRSLAAIRSYLAQYPSIHFILDIHRDAVEDAQGTEYKVVAASTEEGVPAQMTLVVGSDGSGLAHPNWMENLKLAVSIQRDIAEEDATLMRPMLLRNSRYNQHATTGSLLVEVGAAGNSPEEAALAGRIFARHMAEVLEARSK